MNLLHQSSVLAILVALLSGCATEQKREDKSVARLESAAHEFKLSKRRYPRSVSELQAFLASRKTPETLDLEPFAELEFMPSKGDSFGMFYKGKRTPPDELGVLVRTSAVSSPCGSLGQSGRRVDK